MPVALTESGTPEQNANSQQALKEALALVRKYQTVPPVAESGTPEQNVNFAGAIADLQGLAAKYKLDIGEYAATPSPTEQSQALADQARFKSRIATMENDMAPPEKPEFTPLEQVAADVGRGFNQLGQIGYGLGMLGGNLVGSDGIEDWGLSGYQRKQEAIDLLPPAVGSYKRVLESPSLAPAYAMEALAENVAMFLPSLLTGGVGAVLARKAVQEAVEKSVAAAVARGVALKVAQDAARKTVAKQIALGAAAGAYPSAAAMEAGTIYPDILEKTGVKAPGTALLYGAAAGALDVLPTVLFLNRVVGPAATSAVRKGLVRRVGEAVAEQVFTEGVTEGLQTTIERMAVKSTDPTKGVFTDEGITEIIDSILKGGLAGGALGVGAAFGERKPTGAQPPPLPSQANPDQDLVQLYERAVTERRRLILTGTPHTDPRILQIDRLTEDLTQQMRDKTAASKPVKENPTAPIKPSVAPADLLGRTFAYNEQGTIARIVGATSQGVEIETPEGKANVSYAQWQTTPQDVFDRTKTQTELPYAAAIAKPAMVKIIAPKLSTPPAGTVSSQPAAEPVTAAASIAGVQSATPSRESEQTKPGVTAAQTPVAGGVVPSSVKTPKSSTQLTLPTGIAKPFTDFSKSIPDSDVYRKADERGREDFGIETEPHITVLYGLTEHDPYPVRRIIQGGKPIMVTLGKISVFESPEYDVLKVDVKGGDLVNLNSQMSKLPNEQTFKGYKPHLTLAYLKKGAGKKYTGDTRFAGQKLTFNSVTFSPPSEIRESTGRTEIPLSNAPTERTLDEVLTKTDTAAPVAGVPPWLAVITSSHRQVERLRRSIPHTPETPRTSGAPVSMDSKNRVHAVPDTPKNRATVAKLGLKTSRKHSAEFNLELSQTPAVVAQTEKPKTEEVKTEAPKGAKRGVTLKVQNPYGLAPENEKILTVTGDVIKLKAAPALDFFIYKSGRNGYWTIVEKNTGQGIGGISEKTRAAAIQKAEDKVSQVGPEKMRQYVDESVWMNAEKRMDDMAAERTLPEISFSQVDPPFYSRITRAIEQSSQARASGAQWKATIRNSKLGINRDEYALVGVEDLEDGKTYTKQEVLDYLKANEVVVNDVTLGEGISSSSGYRVEHGTPTTDPANRTWDVYDNDGNYITSAMTEQDAWVALKNNIRWARNRLKELQDKWRGSGALSQEERNELAVLVKRDIQYPVDPTHFSQYQLPGAKEGSYREVLLTVPQESKTRELNADVITKREKAIESLKRNDFLGFDNASQALNAVLTHPDWAGRWDVRDLEDTVPIQEFVAAKAKASGMKWSDGHSQYQDVKNPIVRLRFNERLTSDGKKMLFLEEVQAPQKGQFEKMPALFQKNWREIAFKWALRHAAENGFDSVGWTTGTQQAERYDLSKQVDAISYYKQADGKVRITAEKGGDVKIDRVVEPDGVEAMVGKEIATKINAGEGRQAQPGWKTISGADLKIGGEGLKKLYDVDFRNVVNNLSAVKKSGQKVGSAELITGKGGKKIPDGAGGLVETGAGREPIHSLDITTAIRESVMGGQAMFSQRAASIESGLTVEDAQKSMRPMLADFPEANRPQIVVAPTRDWPSDTQALIPAGKIVNGATHRRTVNGKTVTTIYIDPEQIGSDEELRQVLAEELVGHSGMAALISESEIDRLYELLNRSRPERVAELSKDVGTSGDTITGRRAIVDEFLGESARTLPSNDPLWRQLFDAIVNALRRLSLLPASLDETKLDAWVRQLGRQANRRLRSGRYNVDDKVILPEIAFSVKTLMHGVPQEVGGTQAPEYDRPAGLEETVRRFNRSGLPVVRTGRTHGYVRLLDEGPPATTQLALQMDKAGRLLVEEFKNVPQEARELGQPGSPPNDRLGSFVDAGRFMAKRMLDEHDAGRGAAFSREILEEIFSYTQDEASERGRNLASLNQQEPKNVLTRGKYMGVELRQDLRTRFDPNGQIADVLKVFRDRFTSLLGLTKDDAGLLASLETFLNDLLARQPVQNASKLYRWVHQALKPQFAKSMNALEQDSFLREAVRQLIANANLFGHETPERKTKPLTALAQLLLKANPSAVAKMDAMIANAVRTGELKAARAWLVEQGASEDELADFDDGIRVPTPAEIEAGLALPEHKHWKVIRDNLLGYSPVTDALVGKVLRGDFKGIKPKPGAPKPAASPKIDLIALAKEPDVEVQRVFDEYAKNIQDMLDLNGAMPWMQTRIVMQIRKQLADQLAGQREAIRNRFFTPRKERTESDTPSERFQALVNAGLLDDERMLNGMLTEAARKSTVTKLLPSMADMVEMVLSTPLSRRTEAAERFAALLAEQFQLIPEQEDQARKLFTTAFEEKFKRAEAKAREEAFEKLTPEQKEEAKKKPSRSLWKHVQRVLNTGLFTDMAVYAEFNNRGIALSEADIAKVSGLVEKAEALTRPTAEQIAAANGDQAKLDAAARENEALHYGDIKALERRITALWTRNFKPLSLIGLFTSSQVRENATRAFFDHITANILFTINFVARNPIDVWFSTQLHRVTNARGHAFEQLNLLQEQAVREGKPAPSRAQMLDLWGENFLNGISIRYKTRKEKYTRYREAWAKRGLPSRIEGMTSTMATFERTEELLSELWAKGEAWSPKLALSRAKSIALAIVTVDRFAFRFAGTLDVLQATPIGWQEFRSLLTTELIRLGLSKAERITWEEAIIGQIDTDLQGAARDAAAKFSAEGITPSRSQLNAGAWQLVFARMAERAYELGTEDRRVNMEAIKERISELQQYSGWNLPEGGLGGFFRKGSEIGQEALIALRLPIPLALFGNALAMAANRGLNFTGLPFYAQLLAKGVNLGLKPFGVELPEKSFSPYQFSTPSIPESPGAKYLSNQGQRQAEAEIGAFIGPMVAYAVLTGLFHWYGKEPEDELERAERRRRGILPQSLGIPLPGTNRELPIPLMVAPGSFVAAWAAFAGALVARHDRKKEAHGKLVAESVERGLAPPPSIGGPIAEADAKDYAVATIVGLGTSVAGGRTATGKLNPLADYRQLIRDPDSVFKRMIVQQASPIVTGLPAYQKLAWASGVNIDVKTASVLELAVPLPWSGARKVNALGENVEDPRFWNHFIAATTGGFGVTAEETEQAHANFVLAGYHPPMPPLQQAYDFKGQYRPMTTAEYQTYVQRTGAGFKRNLTELGDISGMPDDQRWSAAQRAYHSAQRQTIEEMGFTPKPERQPSGGSARPKPAPVVNRPRAAALPRSSRFGSRGFSVRVPSFAPTKLKRGRRSRSSRRLFASVPRSRRVKLSRVRSRTKSRRRLFSV